jgi:hypothetical protein
MIAFDPRLIEWRRSAHPDFGVTGVIQEQSISDKLEKNDSAGHEYLKEPM